MIEISNLKQEKDLERIAEEYSNYYNNSVLEEKWTKESVIKLFKYFHNQALIYSLLLMIKKLQLV